MSVERRFVNDHDGADRMQSALTFEAPKVSEEAHSVSHHATELLSGALIVVAISNEIAPIGSVAEREEKKEETPPPVLTGREAYRLMTAGGTLTQSYATPRHGPGGLAFPSGLKASVTVRSRQKP
ncbi:hypothetical protein EYF80_041701 [Liparis tanakae]|uniref:Uncharacterized protein n=1 Tax=Liparis tanakae TaxID=230148 RepID=A0A4Z2G3C8_9TELE|nr:hypothetical protein EYF80_041701 [Liparis tanakae]